MSDVTDVKTNGGMAAAALSGPGPRSFVRDNGKAGQELRSESLASSLMPGQWFRPTFFHVDISLEEVTAVSDQFEQKSPLF